MSESAKTIPYSMPPDHQVGWFGARYTYKWPKGKIEVGEDGRCEGLVVEVDESAAGCSVLLKDGTYRRVTWTEYDELKAQDLLPNNEECKRIQNERATKETMSELHVTEEKS